MNKLSITQTLVRFSDWQHQFTIAMILILLALTGCSTSSDESTDGQSAELLISLTDAPGAFSTYTVDVLSLTLTTASGAVVETLPVNTRVDFAQYTDLSEFLTAATVPSARYVKASMQLDYSNAEIWVASPSNQDSIKVENYTDPDGNTIDILDVSVHLENRNSLIIVPGVPAFLTLDFNLDASNEITYDNMGAPTLIVQPLLIAEIEPERPKIHRVRGPLIEVDATNNNLKMVIHPFIHRLQNDDHRFGKLPVNVDDDTIYDIDGQRYQGQAGLDALASMPKFTATIARGDFRFRTHRFEAKQVYAGSSVPGGDMDVVSGNVIKRVGTTLTVQGATLIRSGGTVVFNNSVEVELSSETGVRKLLSMADHSIDEISVGQKVRIFGALQVTIPESPMILDATASDNRVFMGMTVLRGFSVDTMGPMIVDLQTINFRNINLFDFAGTGIDATNDADPSNYEIDTGTLDTSGMANGVPVAVGGFATPFGQAPLDFEAQTVVDLSALPGVMVVNWEPAATAPFDTLSTNNMVLNLTGAGVFHHVGRAGVRVDLTDLLVSPTIQPVADKVGLYVIKGNGSVQLFIDFALYTDALQTELDNGSTVRSVTALGDYDDITATIMAERVLTRIE
jgi:hypothetical protein